MVAIVFLDANFLYVPLQFRVDVFEEIPRVMEERTILVLLPGIKEEIVKKNTLRPASQESRQGVAALHLAAIKEREGRLHPMNEARRERETVDDYIVRIATVVKEKGAAFDEVVTRVAIATNDKAVRQACETAGIHVVTLRQKRYLTLS